jgi:hypothetical protein
MKITIERGEATTTVHVEGSGHYSCLNEQIDDPWLTTGRALNRMSDCGEGEHDYQIGYFAIAAEGPVGRAAIRIMAASLMTIEERPFNVDRWVTYWSQYYPEVDVSGTTLRRLTAAKKEQLERA